MSENNLIHNCLTKFPIWTTNLTSHIYCLVANSSLIFVHNVHKSISVGNSVKCGLTQFEESFKLRLHEQFFTRDCNAIFRNYCVAIGGQNWNLDTRCTNKTADRKIAQNTQSFNFSAIFQKLLHYQLKTFYTHKFIRATVMQKCLEICTVIARKKLHV